MKLTTKIQLAFPRTSSRRAWGQQPTAERGWSSAMAVDRSANDLSSSERSALRTKRYDAGTRIWTDHSERPQQFKIRTSLVTCTFGVLAGRQASSGTEVKYNSVGQTDQTRPSVSGPGFDALQREVAGSSATSTNFEINCTSPSANYVVFLSKRRWLTQRRDGTCVRKQIT
jgi:hypothetical protein